MASKLRVFLAHSFEKDTPPGETVCDVEVVDWFSKLLKKRPLSFQVVTGAKPTPGPISEKVTADIADCSCVIAVFTKRHFDSDRSKWLPPQFVLCECASAIGFYYNTNKVICGFYEEGIDPKDLALITIGGLELVPFNRNNLENRKGDYIEYLKKLPDIVASGSYREGQIVFLKPPYIQQRLYKIYTVYRNGNVTVQNLNSMLITDIDGFNREHNGEISHEIWHRKTDISPLSEMLETPIDQRKEKPFLKGMLRQLNQKRIDVPLTITPNKVEGGRAFFTASFHGKDGSKLKLKNQDTIRYQYAWGLPCAYPTSTSQLKSPVGGREVDEEAYCHGEVFASHGLVKELILELRFEQGIGSFFSKSPFFQATASFGDLPKWSLPRDLPLLEEEDHAMWFQTFRLVEHNFNGRIRVMWRPKGSTN